MAKMSDLFDGEVHYIDPVKDFKVPTVTVVKGWDEDEDELDELGPYESPSPLPLWHDNPATYNKNGPLPFQLEEASWASLSIALGSLCTIVGGSRVAHEHVAYGSKNEMLQPTYTFKFEPGKTGFQKGRL